MFILKIFLYKKARIDPGFCFDLYFYETRWVKYRIRKNEQTWEITVTTSGQLSPEYWSCDSLEIQKVLSQF